MTCLASLLASDKRSQNHRSRPEAVYRCSQATPLAADTVCVSDLDSREPRCPTRHDILMTWRIIFWRVVLHKLRAAEAWPGIVPPEVIGSLQPHHSFRTCIPTRLNLELQLCLRLKVNSVPSTCLTSKLQASFQRKCT